MGQSNPHPAALTGSGWGADGTEMNGEAAMTFDEILDQALALLQRRGG